MVRLFRSLLRPWFYRRRTALFTAVLLTYALIYRYYRDLDETSFVSDRSALLSRFSRGVPTSSTADAVRNIYKPFIHTITAPSFTSRTGEVYRLLAKKPRFTKPLGKNVLILDVDSRPLDGPGWLLNDSQLVYDDGLLPGTAGRLSHYMFAMIHGYDYKLIQSRPYSDRHGTWTKVPVIKEALQTYDFVVFMDADTMFPHPHLPLEWLFNYWDITPDTLVAMALDPNQRRNRDARGQLLLNTGFIIAQQSPRTRELFQAWETCPEETRYQRCSQWKHKWSHEQAAFGNYVRYDFDRPNDVKSLPCAEANGYPEVGNQTGCVGEFVRHYWINKHLLPEAVEETVMRDFIPQLHEQFRRDRAEIVLDAKDYKFR